MGRAGARGLGACGGLLSVLLGLVACQPTPRFAVGGAEFAGSPGTAEPSLAPGPDGGAVLTWFAKTAGGHRLLLSVRQNGVWQEPLPVVQERDFFVNWADFPSFVALDDGTWIVHWLERVARAPYAYHVKLAISRDRGATWSAPLVPHSDQSPKEHGFVSMVPWEHGAALVWLDGRGMGSADGHDPEAANRGAMSLRFTTVAVDGTVGEDVLLDGRTCECCQTALVRTRRGLVAAYRDRSDAEIRDVAVVRYVRGRWSDPVIVGNDNWHYPGCPVNGPQLAARGDTVALAWFAAPEQAPRVQVAFSSDAGESFGSPIRIDDGQPAGRVDIEFLPDGTALVVWLELTEEAAELRARRISSGGRTDPSWSIAQTASARASGFPRMVVAGDEILIAWTKVGDDGGVRVTPVRFLR